MGSGSMDDKALQAWLAVVERDMKAIRNNLYGPEPEPSMAAYHCQQAVEKLLKTVLVAAGVMPPKSHDLDLLIARLPAEHPIASRARALSHLVVFLSGPRYPGPGIFNDPPDDPSVEEVVGWLGEIEALRADILRFLGLPS